MMVYVLLGLSNQLDKSDKIEAYNTFYHRH